MITATVVGMIEVGDQTAIVIECSSAMPAHSFVASAGEKNCGWEIVSHSHLTFGGKMLRVLEVKHNSARLGWTGHPDVGSTLFLETFEEYEKRTDDQ